MVIKLPFAASQQTEVIDGGRLAPFGHFLGPIAPSAFSFDSQTTCCNSFSNSSVSGIWLRSRPSPQSHTSAAPQASFAIAGTEESNVVVKSRYEMKPRLTICRQNALTSGISKR